jgi:hypothetical protein
MGMVWMSAGIGLWICVMIYDFDLDMVFGVVMDL